MCDRQRAFHRRLLLPLALFLVLAASRGATAAPNVYVSGRVMSADPPQPVADAVVSLFAPGAADPVAVVKTLGNGTFVLQAPPGIGYRLKVNAGADFAPAERKLDVPLTTPNAADFVLGAPPHMEILVLGPDGKPVPNTKVQALALALPREEMHDPHFLAPPWFVGEAIGAWTTRRTSSAGIIRVNVPDGFDPGMIGAMGVGVRAAGVGCGWIRLPTWRQDTVTVLLGSGAELTGFVPDEAGQPASGIPVRAIGMSLNLPFRFLQGWSDTTTDARGHFTIPSLYPDRYDLQAQLGENKERFKVVKVTGPRTEVRIRSSDRSNPPLDLHFYGYKCLPTGMSRFGLMRQEFAPAPATVAVSGTVTTREDGKPPSSGCVQLVALTPGVSTLLDAAPMDADGHYTLEAPGGGQYSLQCQADGRSTIWKRLTITGNAPVSQSLVLSKAEPLRIRLLGPEGAPVTTGQTSIWHWYRWPNNAGGSGQGQRPFPESGVVNFDPPDNVDELKEAFIGIQVEGIGLGQWRLEKWPDNAGASTFRLSAGATLVGTVVNANGAPLPNTKVTLSAHIEKPIFYGLDEKGKWEDPLPVTGGDPFFAVSDRHAFTDRDGRFTFSFLPYGGYEVRAAIPDVGVRYAAVEVNRPKVEASLSPADQSSTKARFADR